MVSRAQAVIDMCAENPETLGVWPLPIKRALDVLTHKQRHFAINIASGLTQVEAYKSAYDVPIDAPASKLSTDACHTLDHPKITTAVVLMREWLDTKWLLDNGEGIDYGLSVAFEVASTSTDDKVRLRAAETILRVNGAFVSRSEVRHIHQVDTSQTEALLSTISDLIGLAVPKPPSIPGPADVASVTFTDPE